MEQERRKIEKGGKLKMEGRKVTKWGEDFFLFCFVFGFFFFFVLFCFVLVFFCFSLLKPIGICFGSTKMEIFYWEKAFHARKKIRRNDFAPSEKYSSYAPVCVHLHNLSGPLGGQLGYRAFFFSLYYNCYIKVIKIISAYKIYIEPKIHCFYMLNCWD